jgi:hypothetical protein
MPTKNIGETYPSNILPTENELEKRAYIKIMSGVIKNPKKLENLFI